MVILFIGNVDPIASAVRSALVEAVDQPVVCVYKPSDVEILAQGDLWPDLVVVAGWRHLIGRYTLDHCWRGAVGFHSAKLPEYPGRAPVPWTLLRGDTHAYNTFFYLDAGVDSGDIIDQASRPIRPDETPATLNEWMAESSAAMLRRHLAGLLDGTAPRTPQDPAKRGPLTTKDGWDRLAERDRLAAGHA